MEKDFSISLIGKAPLILSNTLCRSSFFLVLALLPFQFALSQISSASGRLLADFYDETNNASAESDSNSSPEAIRSILPPELWNIANPGSIGISDAGPDSATGYRQAWFRALMLLALQQNSEVKMVAENFKFTTEVRGGVKSRFEEMYSVEAEIDLDSLPRIEACFRLTNGETILILAHGSASIASVPVRSLNIPTLLTPTDLVSPHLDSSAPGIAPLPDTNLAVQPVTDSGANETVAKNVRLKVKCLLYHLEVEANRTQQVFRTEYTLTGLDSLHLPDHETFGYTSVNGRWCNFSTHWNGEELPKGNTRYFYYNGLKPVLPDSTLTNSIGMATVEGLWPALITGVLWQITGIAADSNTTIRQVSDHYDQSSRDLSRVTETQCLSFQLQRLAYASARLYTLLDIKTQSPEKQ